MAGLETVTYITDLDQNNPASSDDKSEGDDHLRNIKKGLANTFSGFTGEAMTRTEAALNDAATKTGTETLTNKTITSAAFTGTQTGFVGTTTTYNAPITLTTGNNDITSIPAWVNKITINFGVGVNYVGSTANLQLGTAGSWFSTGYSSRTNRIEISGISENYATTAFEIAFGRVAASPSLEGIITLTLADTSTNTWVLSGSLSGTDTGASSLTLTSNGLITLSAELTRLRLTGFGASGLVNVLYE